MKYVDCVNDVIKRIAEPIKVRIYDDIYEGAAFIQPMRYKNKLYLEMQATELGLNDAECFLYLGPPEIDFTGSEEYTAIYTDNKSYSVSRADQLIIDGKILYIWAVLNPRVKENEYDKL